HAIKVLAYDYPRLDLEVRCGKGTYIRALARDLGERLGCGAYLECLRRTRVGAFLAEDALSLDADKETALSRLLPLAEAVRDLRALVLADDQVERLRTGQEVPAASGSKEGEEIALVSATGALLAVGDVEAAQAVIRPRKVFVSQEQESQ